MIAFYVSLAEKWYARRWHLAAVTGLTFAVLLAVMLGLPSSPNVMAFAGILSGPVIAVSWGLLLAAVWFHPAHGKLMWRPSANRVLAAGRSFVRGYAAVFLAIWFIFGTLVWPVFGIYTLWA